MKTQDSPKQQHLLPENSILSTLSILSTQKPEAFEKKVDLFNVPPTSDVDEQESLIEFYKRYGQKDEYFIALRTYLIRLG